MSIIDDLIGKGGLQAQRDKAKQFAVERYDPNDFNYASEQARRRATEGLYEGEEQQARQRTIDSLFRQNVNDLYGAGSGRQLSYQNTQNQQRQAGLSQFESNLTQADLQARRQGENQYAQVRTQQEQTESQRQAAFQEADMQYEAALEQRRQQLMSTVGKVAGTAAAFIPGVGPLAAGAIGAGTSALVGGGGAALSGAASGLQAGYMMQQNQPSAQQTQNTGGSDAVQQVSDDYQEILDIGSWIPETSQQTGGNAGNFTPMDNLFNKGQEFGAQLMNLNTGLNPELLNTQPQPQGQPEPKQYDTSSLTPQPEEPTQNRQTTDLDFSNIETRTMQQGPQTQGLDQLYDLDAPLPELENDHLWFYRNIMKPTGRLLTGGRSASEAMRQYNNQ